MGRLLMGPQWELSLLLEPAFASMAAMQRTRRSDGLAILVVRTPRREDAGDVGFGPWAVLI